jgi:type IV pilus assembly protein PilB
MPEENLEISAHPERRKEAVRRSIQNLNQNFKEREVMRRAKLLGVKYINLLETPINPDMFMMVPKEVSYEASLVPFYRIGNKIRIAFTDPNNEQTKRALSFLEQKFIIDKNICSEESLRFAQRGYEKLGTYEEEEIRALVDEEREINLEEELKKAHGLPKKMEGVKTDKSLNMLHEVVLSLRVSDIHFQPEENETIIRARVDGILRTICVFTKTLAGQLVQQIKHDAQLKYNITNIPQDGKYSFLAKDRSIDVRVSTFPTNYGESVVLRFLDGKKGIVPFEKLGFSPRIRKQFGKAIAATGGMILVTGPTGSGKTTTLYSSIAKINLPEKKILTLEDPIEFRLPGVLQSGINHRVGFDFASGLRSLLRQDPDVVLVGEIRDQETADAAVQAALTGHVVFSTLHTNSAPDAIPRLLNMGIKPFVLAPALRMVAAQRLVRTICKECEESYPITPEEKNIIDSTILLLSKVGIDVSSPRELKRGKGCNRCCQSGYRGETAVIEILEVNDAIQEQMYNDFSSQNISRVAQKDGFLTMWQEGILKVINGETTLAELKRKVEER